MTEQELRSKVVNNAVAWLGCRESDGSHKKIIDVYNGHRPLARSYRVKYTDAWCATYVSAVAIASGVTDILPTECSCAKMIELFKKLGAWVEADDYTPKPGDVCFYDWEDNGQGDNAGHADHVGLVERIQGQKIYVIEGNYSNAVKRRTITLDGKYIRGYGVPDYAGKVGATAAPAPAAPTTTTQTSTKKDDEAVVFPVLKKGSTGPAVKAMQILLIGYGYSCGKYKDDGDFGADTEKAVRKYQQANSMTVDGKAGPDTLGRLYGLK